MAEKKGHNTSVYQFLLFSQTLPGKIDRLVWHITLPCVAKNHTTQQNRTYQPTYTPTICIRFIIFPLGPWLRRRKCWTKRHSNSMVVSFFEDLGSFFAEKSRVEQKIARRCGEKRILKWKCTKHVSFGALFEVLMLKNCTPLWRNAHSEVKMLKNWGSRCTFWSSDVEKLHAAVAKCTFWSQNVKKLRFSENFLRFWCRKISQVVS